MATVEYTPLRTCEQFIRSRALYGVICGARGSGKTTSGLMRTVMLAREMERGWWPLKWAVIRDTRRNLGMSLARTIRAWIPAPYSHLRGGDDEPDSCDIYIGGKKNLEHILHFDFFGVNSASDHSRFQSYEATGGVWIEEPCPLRTNTESVSTGVGEGVLASAVTCLRAAPRQWIQVSMNPPSGDHWTAQLWHMPGYEPFREIEEGMEEEQRKARETIREQSELFMTPASENSAELVSRGYVQRNRDILLATGDRALYQRLVEGRVGSVDVGVRVAPEFHAGHIVGTLPVIGGSAGILSWDFGLNPTCIVAQITPQGYVNIVKSWSRENMGMSQLIEGDVQPWLGQSGLKNWWYCGGVEARQREQSNSEETALKVIIGKLGNGRYVAAPVSWSGRRQALKEGLLRSPGGYPWVRISQEGCGNLIRCLDGGWCYATDASEMVRNEMVPPKNKYSHLGDAMCALMAALLPKTERVGKEREKFRYPLQGNPGVSRTRV